MSKVVLLVADAGPLISLAKADRLDLLLALKLPVHLVDQVRYEVTRNQRLIDAVRIEKWLKDNAGQVFVFTTYVGEAAAQRRQSGETRQPGQGEAAIAEFLNRLDEVTGDPDAPALLIYEDSDIKKSTFVLPPNIHLIATSAYLQGLERRHLIPSAQAVWILIETAGRRPSKSDTDEPGTTEGEKTSW